MQSFAINSGHNKNAYIPRSHHFSQSGNKRVPDTYIGGQDAYGTVVGDLYLSKPIDDPDLVSSFSWHTQKHCLVWIMTRISMPPPLVVEPV